MSSELPRKKTRHVCLICGSYTTLMINIYEPRSGPNIVDVINQKFGMQPLHDDKFLCYSCNNWLINWHSLQNKNEASSSKTSKNTRLNQSIPEERQHESMAHLVDQYADILRLRSKLKQYFYYPKKATVNVPKSAIQRIRAKCHMCRLKSAKVFEKRLCSFRSRRSRYNNRKKCLRFCHRRKQTVHSYGNKFPNIFSSTPLHHQTVQSHSQRRTLDKRSSQTIIVNPYVVSRLKKLGTTVVCEGTSATDNDLSRYDTTNNGKKIDSNVTRSGENEFLITFDTALQEVFPVDLSEEKDVVVEDFSEIFQRIPKSLSITLA